MGGLYLPELLEVNTRIRGMHAFSRDFRFLPTSILPEVKQHLSKHPIYFISRDSIKSLITTLINSLLRS